MNFSRYFLASLVGGFLGCAVTFAFAQQDAPANGPQDERFTECVSYMLGYGLDQASLADAAKPIGDWTPVGGAGGSLGYNVILCR